MSGEEEKGRGKGKGAIAGRRDVEKIWSEFFLAGRQPVAAPEETS